MAFTYDLVEQRFDDAQTYAEEAIEKANEFMDVLSALLEGLELPDVSELEDVVMPTIPSINYGSIPDFNAVLEDFPSFANLSLADIILEDVPDITSTIPIKSFNFVSNTISKPSISYGEVPDSPSLISITLPDKPEITLPTAPVISEVTIPTTPSIDIAKFTAIAPSLEDFTAPVAFNYTEAAYSSDIRAVLFNKILEDIINGGTGLAVDVEQDIWDRYLSRQTNENDRLYQEVQNQFSATGFGLPSGAYASRLLQVSNDISAKNDDANRDIAIKQAELAQNNTQFTITQAGILEKMLTDFFSAQQDRSLQAQQILASNAIELYNALMNRQNILLEQYKTEAEVFDIKVRAELAAIEIYKAEIEGAKATVDVQQARVDLYNSQVASLDVILKIYQTEMDSAKTQAEIQNLQLTLFKIQIDAYVAGIQGESVKADIYKTEIEAEGVKAEIYGTEVSAYESEVRGRLGVLEAEKIKAENKISQNQLLLTKYQTQLERYKVEIDSEIKTANLAVQGYAASTDAYEATTAAKETEFRTIIADYEAKIEVVKAQLAQAEALISSETNSYVALKGLAVQGTEGIMNTNAQLAASAMNAVNASASQGISSSSTDTTNYSESHNYSYDG